MSREFSEKIKYIGFIMTCIIVLFHCPDIDNSFCLSNLDYSAKRFIEHAINSMTQIAMYWFFTVTGFLLFRDFSMKKYPSKVKSRVFSLFVPYILWLVIWWVIDVLQGDYVFTVADFIRTTFLFDWPHIEPLWYVYTIFILCLLSPILYFAIKRKNTGWAAVLLILCALKYCKITDNPAIRDVVRYGYVVSIVDYAPAYFVGAFFGYHFSEGKADCLRYLLSALLMAYILDDWLTGFFADLSMRLIPIAMLYLLPPLKLSESRLSPKLLNVHKLSFLMYVLHVPVLEDLHPYMLLGYMHTVGKLTMSAALGIASMSVFCLIVTIAIVAPFYWLLSKKAPRVLALLTGGRS